MLSSRLPMKNKYIARVDICPTIEDTRALAKNKLFNTFELSCPVTEVKIIDSYCIETNLDLKEIIAAEDILVNSKIESKFKIQDHSYNWAIEIGYLPGVTDNIGSTAKETLKDYFSNTNDDLDIEVYSSQVYLLKGDLNKQDIEIIADSLHNPLIQVARILDQEQIKTGGFDIHIPKVKLGNPMSATEVNLDVSDDELKTIGQEGIKDSNGKSKGPLALGLDYMKAIQAYFKKLGRKPTDIELESIAQTWSEHCKHTIFADPIDDIKDGLYKTYIKEATNTIRRNKGDQDFCVSVFSDNSGGIKFDDNHLITHKVETHNSPSALDPFGGAITGIVGVNRDAMGFGLGAKPIANLYGYCFANPDDKEPIYRDPELEQKMLSPRRIMEGVVEGVKVGGNCSGIPTVHGFTYFDDKFKGKPLVFVGTLGLIPQEINGKPSHSKSAQPGDYIVMTGGKVGQDGIHGATFSSTTMDSNSPATAVQIGDPITQKKMSDAIIKEARDRGLYNSITDNGAGGISCSVAEMARECNGCEVELDQVPLKYPGLEPWQIWISESQERMTLAIPADKWQEFQDLMDSRDVEATIIGKFTNSGKCVVKYNGQTIMDLELEFLHNGLPKRQLKSKKLNAQRSTLNASQSTINSQPDKEILDKLASLNHCSTEFISRQYDHQVQSISAIKPLQGRGRINGDVAVIKPLLNSNRAAILSYGIDPNYSEDSYLMAANAIDSAIRSAIATGANPDHLALLDNFCWCSADEPERLYQLKEAARACYDYAVAYGTPFISGKDSMFNDFKGYYANANPIKISIPPTLLISAISVIPDISKVVSMDSKFDEDLIYLLGKPSDALPDAKVNSQLYRSFYSAINKELISSAISVDRGGLAIALMRMSMAGKLGATLSLDDNLFDEYPGRIIASIDPSKQKAFEEAMATCQWSLIGKVNDSQRVTIERPNGNKIVDIAIDEALEAYRSKFKHYLQEPTKELAYAG